MGENVLKFSFVNFWKNRGEPRNNNSKRHLLNEKYT
jgi:hypothetical protein